MDDYLNPVTKKAGFCVLIIPVVNTPVIKVAVQASGIDVAKLVKGF
jgi:hypothetical protein